MTPGKRSDTAGATDRGAGDEGETRGKRARLLQTDVPAYSLEDALRVPEALRDQYGKQPTRPLMVAKALELSPSAASFRMLTGAAMAYGLTDGAAQADLIAITDLGKRIVAPTVEGDDVGAKREAVLRPRVIREFLKRYDGNKLPNKSIALNVLEEFGVPADATGRAYDMITKNAAHVEFFQEIGGSQYVMLEGASQPSAEAAVEAPATPAAPGRAATRGDEDGYDAGTGAAPPPLTPATSEAIPDIRTNKRVFVTHGRNREIVDQLKEVLTFGKFEPVVSVETEATAKPVPDKVMDEMRSCGAGIVHVGAEQTLLDSDGKEHKVLNPNVLIEIGAALALYKQNFILLVERGATLPSNLQGLYEVRYEGGKLDYEATMKLLRAFNEFQLGG